MGYILRLAESNVHDSPFSIIEYAKLNSERNLGRYDSYSILSGKIDFGQLSKIVDKEITSIDSISYPEILPAVGSKPATHDFNYNDVPANYIRFQHSRLCLDCLKEQYFYRYVWDLAPFTACPKHKTLLTDVCPECNKQLSWARSHIHKCQCGYDLYDSQRTVVPDAELKLSIHIAIKLYEDELFTAEQKKLLSINELKMQIPDIIDSLNEAELQNKKRARVKVKTDYHKMPNHLLHHSFFDLYSQQNTKATSSKSTPTQLLNHGQASQYLGVTDGTLTNMIGSMITCQQDGSLLYQDIIELKYRLNNLISYEILLRNLNISSFIADGIIAQGHIELIRGPSKDGFGDRLFDQRDLSNLFTLLTAKTQPQSLSDTPSVTLERYLITRSVKMARSVSEVLSAILSDKIKVYSFEPSGGLPTLELDVETLNAFTLPEEIVIQDYLSVSDICSNLNIYKDAIYRTLKTGLLPYVELDTGKSIKQKVVHVDDFNLFNQQYVFVKELANEYRVNPTNLADKIKDEGVEPISGPDIDNNLIYVFNRHDINNLNIPSIIAKESYETRAGRKTKEQHQASIKSTYDHLDLMDATQVIKLLNSDISIQKLSQLVKKGLLAEVKHNGILGNKRFFEEKEINRYLDAFQNNAGLISIELAAKKLNESSKRFYNNWLKFRRLEMTEDGLGNKYVTKNELAKIAFFKKAAYSAADAAERLGVDRSYISNLKKLGKLTPISGPGVDDYGNFFYSIEHIEALDDGDNW